MSIVNLLPFAQFEALGFERKDVLALPSLTLNALLAGKRSQLMTFKKVLLANGIEVNNLTGRLGLEKQVDGSYELKVFVYQATIIQTVTGISLTTEQIAFLKSEGNPIIVIQSKDKSGFTKDMLVQYDNCLNDFSVRGIEAAPQFINGTQLSENQRTDFASGKPITVPDGKITKDLNSLLGYKADFLILSIDGANKQSNFAAFAASLLAIKQLCKTLIPQSSRPYHCYDDDIIKNYIAQAEKFIASYRKPAKKKQGAPVESGMVNKLIPELEELKETYQISLSSQKP